MIFPVEGPHVLEDSSLIFPSFIFWSSSLCFLRLRALFPLRRFSFGSSIDAQIRHLARLQGEDELHHPPHLQNPSEEVGLVHHLCCNL